MATKAKRAKKPNREVSATTAEISTPPQGLRLEWMDPAELKANPKNWRRHPESQVSALAGVLDKVGWAGALLLNERSGFLIDGHARKAIKSGEKVPVLVGSWTEEQEAIILASLDPLAALAEKDQAALDALLASVGHVDDPALDALLESLKTPVVPAITEDEAPIDQAGELQKKWGTAQGQLWLIESKTVPGKCHRLLCGDSTNAEDVQRVMGGERAAVCLTDPPYGMNHKSGMAGPFGDCGITGDADTDARDAALNIVSQLPAIVFGRWSISAPRETRAAIIWDKGDGLGMGALDIPWKPSWEMIFVIGNGFTGERSVGILKHQGIGPYQQARGERFHATQKPVSLFCELIGKCPQGIIFDPFSGSGTTLVAAEQLGRLAYAIEIEPKYVAVCLERMVKLTGIAPRLA